jgi:hydrogenase maturation protease
MKDEVIVAGIGNAFRGDDGVGPAVAELVARSTGARDVGPISEPLDLLGRWNAASLAVLIDATRSGTDPGTIRVVGAAGAGDSPATSTHAFGLRRALALAAALGDEPWRAVIVGIEGDDFSDGNHLSAPVAAAVPRAAAMIEELISSLEVTN